MMWLIVVMILPVGVLALVFLAAVVGGVRRDPYGQD